MSVATDPDCAVDRLLRWAPSGFALYYAAQTALRALAPGGLGLDEAQIALHAQSLDWGYGPQPPLYAWLQIGVFQITGETKFGLALMKNAALCLMALSLWAAARMAGAGRRMAFAGALGAILIPGIGWEAQRALTHTPLALGICAVCLPVFLWTRRRGGLAAHAVLGAALGLAMLSKHNAALLAFGLVAALAMDRRSGLAALAVLLAAAAAVNAPTLFWMLENADAATSAVRKLGMAGESALGRRLSGAAAFATSLGATLGPPGLVAAWLWARPPSVAAPNAVDPGARAALTRAFVIALAAILLAVLISGAASLKERWLTPVVFMGPMLAALWLAPRIDAFRARWMLGAGGALAVILLIGVQVFLRVGDGRPPRQAAPFAALAGAAAASGTILADTDWVAGSMRLAAPGLAALSPASPALRIETPAPVTLVWEARRGNAPPEALLDLYARRFGARPALDPPQRHEAAYGWPHEDRLFGLMSAGAR